MTTLYKKDSKGKIREWNVKIAYQLGVWGIETSDGIKGGKIKDAIFKEAIPNNQFKTSNQKAEAIMQSAITEKLRSNYFESVEAIKDEDILFMPTGCPSGMIWEEEKDKSHVVYPALASGKLDGSKTYSTWRENRVFLNTRSAKEHLNFKHISDALVDFYKKYPNLVLDGEAYNHEYHDKFEELQTIFRQEKPTDEERKLSEEVAKFYIYDVVDLNHLNLSALERQVLLTELFEEGLLNSKYLIYWGSTIVDSEKEYDEFHEKCLDENFEGSVLKIADASYVQRKNKFVMKRKPVFDCEFTIIGVQEGQGTNKGIAAGMTIDLTTAIGMNEGHKSKLVGNTQLSGMGKGWNHVKLKEVLDNKENYIGKIGTFEYGGITKYGNLRFPKFKSLRTD